MNIRTQSDDGVTNGWRISTTLLCCFLFIVGCVYAGAYSEAPKAVDSTDPRGSLSVSPITLEELARELKATAHDPAGMYLVVQRGRLYRHSSFMLEKLMAMMDAAPGNLVLADALGEVMLETNPFDVDPQNHQAVWDTAVQRFDPERLLRRNPKLWWSNVLMAKWLVVWDACPVRPRAPKPVDEKKVMLYLRRAVALAPKLSITHYELAEVAVNLRSLKMTEATATDELHTALKLKPLCPEAWFELSSINRGTHPAKANEAAAEYLKYIPAEVQKRFTEDVRFTLGMPPTPK